MDKQTEIKHAKGKGKAKEGEMPYPEKPSMFLRKGAKGGLYFFSPKKTTIYYMNAQHIRDLLEGKRDFAVIHKGAAQRDMNNG